jgi:transposase
MLYAVRSLVVIYNQKYLVEELKGIRIALVKEKSGGKVEVVVEEMDAKQARLFFLLDLGKFM